MNKKFFIIAMVILLSLLAVLVVIGIRSTIKNDDTLSDTDYPFSYLMKKGNLEIKLDGHRTPKLKWEVQIETDGVVQVAQKGSERRGKAKFIISPSAEGTTRVNIVRAVDMAGTKVEVAIVTIPIYVAESNGSLVLSCLENPYLIKGPDVIGESTSNPVILNNSEAGKANAADGTANEADASAGAIKGDICFANGKGDWVLESLDGNSEFAYFNDGGKDYATVSKVGSADSNNQNLSEGALVKTAEISLSSQSLKISEKLQVTFNDDGTVKLSRLASE